MQFQALEPFFRGRRILVTGGAGFIGSHLVNNLVALGARVRILDDFSSGHEANLAPSAGKYELVRASIESPDAVKAACRQIEIILHEAALASVPHSVAEPHRFHEVNINGTFRLLEAARAAGVRRFVFASSSSVYGDQPDLPKNERQMPDPLSPYAMQKLAAEYMLRVWAVSYGMECVSLRYFNIFGPNQRADSAYAAVIAAFASRLLKGEACRIFGDGTASRDFTYIDNVVQANLLAVSRGWDDPADHAALLTGGIMNIGCGTQVSIRELAEVMSQQTGVNKSVEFSPPRAGDVLHSHADISRARSWIGYNPTIGLQEGLKATLSWYRSQIMANSLQR